MISRRNWFLSSAALAAASQASAQMPSGKFVSISSSNGLRAVTLAVSLMKQRNYDTLDAAISGSPGRTPLHFKQALVASPVFGGDLIVVCWS